MAQAVHSESTMVASRDIRGLLRAVIELCKPGITRLVLITTACGIFAAPSGFSWVDAIATLVGTALVVAGANALNMFLERDVDCYMKRTSVRPLPTGRLLADEVLAFGVTISVLGLILLSLFVTKLAVGLAILALVSYVLVYTPLKQVTDSALYVGALPGALPPAIGYAAVTGTLDNMGLCLFLILFVWQLPHFLAIAIFRRDEYGRAGHQVMPVVRGVRTTRYAAFGFSLLLLATTLLPLAMGLQSITYTVIAGVSGSLFCLWAARGAFFNGDDTWARKLFFASLPHLVIVMATLVIVAP
jgi:protoheme IX farnesyltransferase